MTDKDKNRIFELEARIETGDVGAMLMYADLYTDELFEEITDEIAEKIVDCYEKCIDAGILRAALSLGSMYYGGEYIPRDFKKAFKYYQMATESTEHETKIRAYCNLGYCYYYGRDVPVDDEKAFKCYLYGALRDDSNCLYKLGDMYRYGRFVKKDLKMAVNLYQRALKFSGENYYSYPDICKRLGECALYGIEMKKDALKALEYLSKAEFFNYKKIISYNDPFAASLLPEIQEMLAEAKKILEEKFN